MRTRITSVALWIVALLFVAQTANAQSFEGRITQRITAEQMGDEAMEMVMNFKGEKMMIDMDMGPMGSSKIFMGEDKSSITVVMESQKMGMQIAMPKEAATKTASSNTDALIKPTGKKETVNGYAAEEWVAEIDNGVSMSMWLTGDLDKALIKSMHSALKMQEFSQKDEKQSAISRMIAEKGLVPVKTTVMQNGETAAVVDLVKVEKTSIPDSVFVIPAGITIQNMEDMMGGQGEDHEGHGHEGHQH